MAKQPKGRDFPLSPTPEKADATHVSKVKPSVKELYPSKPDYSYKQSNYNKKDSSDYKKGYVYGIKEVSSNPDAKNRMRSGKYEKGRTVVGLNDRYNEGFSEGKDKVLSKSKK